MTEKPVLLVEGQDDKRFFKRLIGVVCSRENDVESVVQIDAAAMIDSPAGCVLGNREKVEAMCAAAEGTPAERRIVGFVDRDYRGFVGCSGEQPLADQIGQHHVNGRLVWSRGHSIENYCFDFAVLREPLRTFSVTDSFDVALNLFERHFVSALRVACSASLAGAELGRTTLPRDCVRWEVLDLGEDGFLLGPAWEGAVRSHCTGGEVSGDQIVDAVAAWRERVRDADGSLLRWLCHGHTGLRILWSAYARCVYEASGRDQAQTARVLSAQESVRFNACVEAWLNRALVAEGDWPSEVLRLLGLGPARRRSPRGS